MAACKERLQALDMWRHMRKLEAKTPEQGGRFVDYHRHRRSQLTAATVAQCRRSGLRSHVQHCYMRRIEAQGPGDGPEIIPGGLSGSECWTRNEDAGLRGD